MWATETIPVSMGKVHFNHAKNDKMGNGTSRKFPLDRHCNVSTSFRGRIRIRISIVVPIQIGIRISLEFYTGCKIRKNLNLIHNGILKFSGKNIVSITIGWNGYRSGSVFGSAGPGCRFGSGFAKMMWIRPNPDPHHGGQWPKNEFLFHAKDRYRIYNPYNKKPIPCEMKGNSCPTAAQRAPPHTNSKKNVQFYS